MGFDWFTFAAQIANFLILLWLLQRFLFRPITGVMEERAERVTARLREATEREEHAREEKRRLEEKRRELDQRREAILEQAEEEAEERREEIVASAHEEGEKIADRWHESVEREQAAFLHELRERSREALVDAVRKALEGLADTELESRMRSTLVRRIEQMDEETIETFRNALAADRRVVISTSYETEEGDRDALVSALHSSLDEQVPVEWKLDETMVCGLEMRIGSQRVGWTIRRYLEDLEDRLRIALDEARPNRMQSESPEEDEREDASRV